MSIQHQPEASHNTAANMPILSYFYVGMAVFLIVMILLGFGSMYGRQLVFGQKITGIGVVKTDWVIHLHAADFASWMFFFLVQTVLVARGRTQWHMAYVYVYWGSRQYIGIA